MNSSGRRWTVQVTEQVTYHVRVTGEDLADLGYDVDEEGEEAVRSAACDLVGGEYDPDDPGDDSPYLTAPMTTAQEAVITRTEYAPRPTGD